MKKVIMIGVCFAAVPAVADTYKCKNADGVTVYQELPCAQGAPGAKMKIRVQESQQQQLPVGDKKGMNDAFESRMAKRDYAGALTFATNDEQRAKARRLKEEKDIQCQSLSIRATQARADSKQRGGRFQHAADAAESEYRLRCS